MFQRLISRPVYLAAIVAVAAFVVYMQTLAPSADFIDAGELATVCATLGIAHPTGYPLFALVGWVFAHLPIPGSIIFRLNIMAAFFTAMGAGGVVLLSNELFSFWMPERITRVKGKGQRVKENAQKSKNKNQKHVAQASSPVPIPTAGGQAGTLCATGCFGNRHCHRIQRDVVGAIVFDRSISAASFYGAVSADFLSQNAPK